MTVIDRLRNKRQASTLPSYSGFCLVQQSPTESFVDPKRTVRRLRKCTSTMLQTQEYCNAIELPLKLCEPKTIDAITRIITIVSDPEAPWNSQGAKMRPAHLIDLFGEFYTSLNQLQHVVKSLENRSRQAAKGMQDKVIQSGRCVLQALTEVANVVFTLPAARRSIDDISDDEDDELDVASLASLSTPSLTDDDLELATLHSAESRSLSLTESHLYIRHSSEVTRTDEMSAMMQAAHHCTCKPACPTKCSQKAIESLDSEWALAFLDIQNQEIRTLRSESWATISDAESVSSASVDESRSFESSDQHESETDDEFNEGLAYLSSISQVSRARTVSITKIRAKPLILQSRSLSPTSLRFTRRPTEPVSPTSLSSGATDVSDDERYVHFSDNKAENEVDLLWGNDDGLDNILHVPRTLCSAKRAEHERNFGKTEEMLVFDRLALQS